jgi:hypothetical protein
MGVIEELRHNRVAAQRHYRTALEIDSKYALPGKPSMDRQAVREGEDVRLSAASPLES